MCSVFILTEFVNSWPRISSLLLSGNRHICFLPIRLISLAQIHWASSAFYSFLLHAKNGSMHALIFFSYSFFLFVYFSFLGEIGGGQAAARTGLLLVSFLFIRAKILGRGRDLHVYLSCLPALWLTSCIEVLTSIPRRTRKRNKHREGIRADRRRVRDHVVRTRISRTATSG